MSLIYTNNNPISTNTNNFNTIPILDTEATTQRNTNASIKILSHPISNLFPLNSSIILVKIFLDILHTKQLTVVVYYLIVKDILSYY